MPRSFALLLVSTAACGGAAVTTTLVPAPGSGCADVIAAAVTASTDGSFTVEATVRSPDTGWEKYADAWEVRLPTGEVVGTRLLTHPHENEQPFTRSLGGVTLPSSVEAVTIAARDSQSGFCGQTFEAVVPKS